MNHSPDAHKALLALMYYFIIKKLPETETTKFFSARAVRCIILNMQDSCYLPLYHPSLY